MTSLPLGAAAQAAQEVPDGVAVQDLALAWVGAGGEDGVEDAFEACQVLIPGRQRPGGHEHAAEVGEGRARGEVVESGVGGLPAAGCQVAQERGDEVTAEPAQGYDRAPGGGQCLIQGLQRGMDRAAGAGQQFGEPPAEAAVRALAG